MSFLLSAAFGSVNISRNFSNATFNLQYSTCNILAFSLSVKIGLILLLSIILLSSLIGNVLIVVIVCRHKELRKRQNYFIVNMAVSDFVLPSTIIPVALSQVLTSSSMRWPIKGSPGLIFCKIERFLEHSSYIVSIESLVCIALDRFVAVVFPMKVRLISPKFRAFVIFATWIFAVITHSLSQSHFKLAEENGETVCTSFDTTSSLYKWGIIFLVFGTLIVITLLYCVITVTLRRQDKALRGTSLYRKDQRKQQAIKMTLYIIAAFYICNLPLLVTFILNELQIAVSCSFSKVLWALTRVMLYSSSTVNPIICLAFVKRYRQGFMEILLCAKKGLTARSKMETGERGEIGEITLRDFRRR